MWTDILLILLGIGVGVIVGIKIADEDYKDGYEDGYRYRINEEQRQGKALRRKKAIVKVIPRTACRYEELDEVVRIVRKQIEQSGEIAVTGMTPIVDIEVIPLPEENTEVIVKGEKDNE